MLIASAAVVPLLVAAAAPDSPDPESPVPSGAAAWTNYEPVGAEPLSPAHLASIAQDEETLNQWVGSLTASAVWSEGNTDERSATINFDAEYRRESDRTTLKALWLYGEERIGVPLDWVLTDRKINAQAQYDYFFTEELYGYGRVAYDQDYEQALTARWQVGAGLGYQWIETEEFKFSTEAGLSWISEDYELLPRNEYVAARLAYGLFWQISEAWSFAQDVELLQSLEDEDDVHGKADSRLRGNLNAAWFVQLQHIYEWDNTPAPGNETQDNRVILSIGWSF